jgi:hypothetical protein
MADIEPYENALDAIPGAHPYPRTSRYHDAEIGIHRQADGTEVRYTKRRLLPPSPERGSRGGMRPRATPSAAASAPTSSGSATSATPPSGGRSPTPTPYSIHGS